jgi:hypothetical protein
VKLNVFEIIAVYDCRYWHGAFVLSCCLTPVQCLYLVCEETASWAELKVVFMPCVMRNCMFSSCTVTRLCIVLVGIIFVVEEYQRLGFLQMVNLNVHVTVSLDMYICGR